MANPMIGTNQTGVGIPQPPAIIAILIGQPGRTQTAPQSLIVRKAGEQPLEY